MDAKNSGTVDILEKDCTLKTLTLVQAHLDSLPEDRIRELEAADLYPRVTLYKDALETELLDADYLAAAPKWRRVLYRFLPTYLAQVSEAFFVKNDYDALISWAENLGIPLAFLLKFTWPRKPHFGIFSWISRPKKAVLLRFVQSAFDRIILMSTRQWEFARNELNIPEERLLLLRWPVDEKFWRPMPGDTDMISSVGREMRDYGSLVKALHGLPHIRCHIAAGGLVTGRKDAWIQALEESGPLPQGVTIGKKKYSELRELYARSRFVVIPLLETETDNGTTSILEAMAMGKAVICSQVAGQADVIEHGVNGLFVPVGDVTALRDAISYLWAHPEIAEEMGRHGREFVVAHHSLDRFVERIKDDVSKVLSGQVRG